MWSSPSGALPETEVVGGHCAISLFTVFMRVLSPLALQHQWRKALRHEKKTRGMSRGARMCTSAHPCNTVTLLFLALVLILNGPGISPWRGQKRNCNGWSHFSASSTKEDNACPPSDSPFYWLLWTAANGRWCVLCPTFAKVLLINSYPVPGD